MKKGKEDFNRLDPKEKREKFEAVKKAFRLNKGNLVEKLLRPANRVPKNKEEPKPKSQRHKSRLGPRFRSCLESIKEAIKKL